MTSNNQHSTALLLAAGLALASPAFSKEKAVVSAPPPMAMAGDATVFVDTPVQIPLQIAGRVVEPLSFLVRKEPKHGTLSALRRTGRNSATLLYTPDARTGPGDDFFSFAAKSFDSPVSAPATVCIRLVERPAILEHPDEIDFGKVLLGDRKERPMVLKNSGAGVASGTVRPNSPWRTGKTGEYRLPAGMASTIDLVFEPLEERDFIDKLQVGPESVVVLRGSGVAPVSWPKEGLVVSPADRETGKAEIPFTNNSPAGRTLRVEWPEFLKGDREITLPANGTAAAKIEISAPLSLKFEGEAEIRSGNFKGRLPIRIFPAPAKLSVSPERGLKLGASADGRALKGHFLIRNTGGSNASLQIIAPPDLVIFPDPSRIVLAGGNEQAFEVQSERLKSGTPNKTIRIQSPGCEPVDISIEAPAATEGRAAVPVEKFLSIPPETEAPSQAALPLSGRVQRMETAFSLKSESREIEICWKLETPKISGFKIEWRRISPGNEGQVNVEWIPWTDAKITVADGAAVARFTRLPRNSMWTIRIIALDEAGNPSPPSPPFQIATKPLNEFHVPAWAWIFLIAPLGAAAFKFWKKYQRGLHAKANARIANLEVK